ncbi:MAG: hypothetical protein GJ680_02835 [Alteromonadaceae bacterium]|nr:hypothetical protein [Alteromonadaceae bacterium]
MYSTNTIYRLILSVLLVLNLKAEVHAQAPIQQLPNELIFLVEAEKWELGDLFALQVGTQNYLSLIDFTQVLDIPMQVNVAEGSAIGWFRSEDNQIIIKKEEAQEGWYVLAYGSSREIVDIRDVAHLGDDIFVSSKVLERLFKLSLNVDERDLKITVTSSSPLPITEKIRRKEGISKFERKQRINNTPSLPRSIKDYQFASLPFLDVQSNITADQENTRSNVSVLASSDLLYMTGEYFLSANDEDGLTSARLALKREDNDGNVIGNLGITQLAIGDVRGVGITRQRNTSNDIGIRFGNNPLNQLSDFDTKDFVGFSQPGWDIELYQNGVLVDAVSVQNDGRYEFLEVPLYFGQNNFELRFFGPQGQRKSEFQQLSVATPKSLKNNWIYDLSITKQNASLFQLNNENERNSDMQIGASLQKGISDTMILKTGITTVTLEDDKRHTLVPLHLDWFLDSGLLSFDYVNDLDGGERYLTNLNYTLGNHGLRLENVIYENFDEEIDSNSNQSYRNQISMSGPLFNIDSMSASYGLRYSNSEIENPSRTDTLSLNTSLYVAGFTMSNTSTLVDIKGELPGTDFKFGNGIFQIDKRFNDFNWRSRIAYLIEPQSEITTVSNSLLWQVNNELSTEFIYNYAPQSDGHSGSILLNWETDYATLGVNLRSDTQGNLSGSLTAKVSMGREPLTGDFHFLNRRLATTGGISARLFEDANFNGIFDEGEKPIPNAAIQAVQSRGRAITNEEGVAFIAGLAKNRATDVELDVGSLEDPFWIPSKEGVSINPRPGVVQTLEIPIVVGGEVEGVIYLVDEKGNKTEGSYSEVQLVSNDTDELVDSTVSGFDGYFLFTQILPGDYYIKISEVDLEQKQLHQPEPFRFTIDADNTLLLGANVDLYRGNAAFNQRQKSSHKWKIQVGKYKSKTVASVMSLAVKKTLAKQNLSNSIQLGIIDGFYTFRSKYGFDRTTAQKLCEIFMAKDLVCKVFTNS